MRVNLGMKFLDTDGKIIVDGKPPREQTSRDAIKLALTAELPEDTQGSPQQVLENKMKNFDLYLKVREETGDFINLTAEEIVLIKPRLGKVFSVLICGPMVKMLDAPAIAPVSEMPKAETNTDAG